MTDDQIAILDFLLDDHFALWDFADSFPAMRPGAADSQTTLLVDIVEKGLVEVTFGRWFENETVALSAEHAHAALCDPASWNPTGRGLGHALELTQTGRDFLRERGIGRPL